MMIPRIALRSVRSSNRLIPRIRVPVKYQRSCFHTSWVLDVTGKELFMPALSPTMETGTIVKWLKKEGDKVEAGDAIADIQTDKAVMTMEIDDDSILAKILVPEGTKDVKVGQLIAITVEADEDWKAVEVSSTAATPPSAPASAASPASPSAPAAPSSGSSTPVAPPPGQSNINMPALSPTMTSGTIVKWLKKEGEGVEPGDGLAEIQTDKALITFEWEEEAILAKILVQEGSEVEVGQLIAIAVEKGMDWKNVVVPATTKPAAAAAPAAAPAAAAPAVAPAAAAPTAAPAAAAADKTPPSGQVYGLAVKRLLEEYGLSSGSIKGTGRPNRLLKSDVLAYIQANNIQKVAPRTALPPTMDQSKGPTAIPSKTHVPAAARPSPFKDVPVSSMRSIIAKRLGESKSTIPHSYCYIDIKMDKLNEIRSELMAESIRVSINDFVTKAVAHALVECPAVNTLYQNGQIIRMPKADVSIAVAIEDGLITPIIFDATAKSLTDISKTIRELAKKARTGGLKPEEFQGGTFTISNLGMFGVKQFSAIINPPQTAILAVGGGREELDAALQKTTKMSATLSYDRRAIEEDEAADFLAVFRALLEDPNFLVAGRLRALRYAQD